MRLFSTAFLACLMLFPAIANAGDTLLNVSYDPTREFYQEYNALFAKHWKQKTGQDISVRQSHGGSGKQARAVLDGLDADVVTLALAYDIDAIARSNKMPANWQGKLPHNSAPYTSTIVFVVRKGNPQNIRDWNDLVKPGVQVITPNPKTSGGARWNYLAAWAYAMSANKNDENKAKGYIKALFANVPVLDTGARGAATTFVQRGIGDVLVTWENEAYLAIAQGKDSGLEIVAPSVSVLAEPPVAVVELNARRKGTLEAAQEYLHYLYSKEGQTLAAKYHYRPADNSVEAKFRDSFPAMKLQTIAELGGWEAVQKKHFADGGVFDQAYAR